MAKLGLVARIDIDGAPGRALAALAMFAEAASGLVDAEVA